MKSFVCFFSKPVLFFLLFTIWTNQNTGTNEICGMHDRVGRTYGDSSKRFGICYEIGTATGEGYMYGIYSSAFGNASKVFSGHFAGRLRNRLSPRGQGRPHIGNQEDHHRKNHFKRKYEEFITKYNFEKS